MSKCNSAAWPCFVGRTSGTLEHWHACIFGTLPQTGVDPLATLVTHELIVSGRECTVVGTRIGAYPAVRDAMSFIAKVQPARLPFIHWAMRYILDHFGSFCCSLAYFFHGIFSPSDARVKVAATFLSCREAAVGEKYF